jgi:hypothetical protein
MSRLLRSLMSLGLLAALADAHLDVHVHSQDGAHHGGIAQLVSGPPPRVAPAHHDCNGRVPHLHPSAEKVSAECFLCASLRRDRGVPTLEPLRLAEPRQRVPVHAEAAAAPVPIRAVTATGPRAPPRP